jgi:DNA-binding MarR family transcriptional regulator
MLAQPINWYFECMKPVHAPERTPDRLRERPTWLLGRAAARASGLLASGFGEHGQGLRGYHYRLLASLEQWGPVSQADLGRDTGIDRSDVTAAVRVLEDLGLVDRKVDPANQRRKVVSITPDGIARVAQLDAVLDGIQESLLEPLTPDERAQLVGLLKRLG